MILLASLVTFLLKNIFKFYFKPLAKYLKSLNFTAIFYTSIKMVFSVSIKQFPKFIVNIKTVIIYQLKIKE